MRLKLTFAVITSLYIIFKFVMRMYRSHPSDSFFVFVNFANYFLRLLCAEYLKFRPVSIVLLANMFSVFKYDNENYRLFRQNSVKE
jgi:hypothetical protein